MTDSPTNATNAAVGWKPCNSIFHLNILGFWKQWLLNKRMSQVLCHISLEPDKKSAPHPSLIESLFLLKVPWALWLQIACMVDPAMLQQLELAVLQLLRQEL